MEDNMNGKCVWLAVAVAMAVTATPAIAHHSFAAEFDANQPVQLKGTVTKIEWMNPHAYFYIDVRDAAGRVTSWGLEMGSPNGLMRQGWTRNSMKVGDEIVVEGSRAKDGSDIANARSVVLGSGEKLFAASSQDSQRQ
jgi:hypothetical protein